MQNFGHIDGYPEGSINGKRIGINICGNQLYT